MILLSLLVVSLLATGISVASFFVPGAVVAALFVVLFYGLLVSVKVYDRHEWAHKLITGEPLPKPGVGDFEDEPSGMEIEPDVSPAVVAAERAGFKIGLVIAAPLAALALLLAAVFLDWTVIGLGALAFFAIMVFMGLPVWLAAMEDEIEEAEERVGIEHPPSIR